MKVLPLAVLLVLQYVCLSITTTVYHSYVYFPGVRIVGLLVLLIVDIVGYVLWRSLIRPQFSVLRDLPQPPVSFNLHPCNPVLTKYRLVADYSLAMLEQSSAFP